jgi:copper transport protein
VPLLVAVLLLGGPVLLLAHQSLRRSEPAKDAHLATAPLELRLTFNEPVDLGLTRIVLLGPAGDTAALGPLELLADSGTLVRTSIRGPLAAGAYRVHWMTAGNDGHPTGGDFGFEILEGAAGLAPTRATEPGARSDSGPDVSAAGVGTGGFDASSPAYVGVRWLLYLSLMVVIGAVAFRLLVIGALGRAYGSMPRWLDDAGERAARLGLVAAVVLVLAALLRLWAQTAAMRAAGLPMDADRLTSMLGATAWGWGWMLQLIATAIVAAGLFRARRPGAVAAWTIAAAATLVLCVTPALAGHAAASPRPVISVTADALHVLGAGGWLGSLAVVMLAGVPAALRLEREERGRAVADLVGAFSPAALAFGALVATTGVVAAWIHLADLTMLWTSGYGRVLLLKLSGLALLGATAAHNWRRVKPRLGDSAGTGTLRRSAALEIALATVVLLVTAVLVATPIEPPPT